MAQKRTVKFREQHNELLAMANELDALLDEACLSKSGTAARTCLNRLIGKLTLHLTIEDNVLYPELKCSKDPTISALLKRSAAEMTKITQAVSVFNDKWRTPSSIQSKPKEFVAESRQVIQLLSKRIKWENQELYAAADRTEGAVLA